MAAYLGTGKFKADFDLKLYSEDLILGLYCYWITLLPPKRTERAP